MIYVDELKLRKSPFYFRDKDQSAWCMMKSDIGMPELDGMADQIGASRQRFSSGPFVPYYVLNASQRSQAIEFGAKAITWREMSMSNVRKGNPSYQQSTVKEYLNDPSNGPHGPDYSDAVEVDYNSGGLTITFKQSFSEEQNQYIPKAKEQLPAADREKAALRNRLWKFCDYCENALQDRGTCIFDTLTIRGACYPRTQFGQEFDDPSLFHEDCFCPFCRVGVGAYHHIGCPQESCPKCGVGVWLLATALSPGRKVCDCADGVEEVLNRSGISR